MSWDIVLINKGEILKPLKEVDKNITINLDVDEIEFELLFNIKMNVEKQDELCDEFIDLIEKENIYWGGGQDQMYIRGCLDISNSKINAKECIDLIERFAVRHIGLINKIKIKTLHNRT